MSAKRYLSAEQIPQKFRRTLERINKIPDEEKREKLLGQVRRQSVTFFQRLQQLFPQQHQQRHQQLRPPLLPALVIHNVDSSSDSDSGDGNESGPSSLGGRQVHNRISKHSEPVPPGHYTQALPDIPMSGADSTGINDTTSQPRCGRCKRDLGVNGECWLCDTQIEIQKNRKTIIFSPQQMMTHLKELMNRKKYPVENMQYELDRILETLDLRKIIEKLKTEIEQSPENLENLERFKDKIRKILQVLQSSGILAHFTLNTKKAEKARNPAALKSVLLNNIKYLLDSDLLSSIEMDKISGEYIKKLVEFFNEHVSQKNKQFYVQQFMPERTLATYRKPTSKQKSEQYQRGHSAPVPGGPAREDAVTQVVGQGLFLPDPKSVLTSPEQQNLVRPNSDTEQSWSDQQTYTYATGKRKRNEKRRRQKQKRKKQFLNTPPIALGQDTQATWAGAPDIHVADTDMMTRLKRLRERSSLDLEKELNSILKILDLRKIIEELKTEIEQNPKNLEPFKEKIRKILQVLRSHGKMAHLSTKAALKSVLLHYIEDLLDSSEYVVLFKHTYKTSDDYLQQFVEFFNENASQEKKRFYQQRIHSA